MSEQICVCGVMVMQHCRKSRQTFLGLVFLGFALVIEAHSALVNAIRLHSISTPKPTGVVYTAKQGVWVKGQGEAA